VRRHFIIPDRQNKPGVPLEHNRWIGQAIAKYQPDVVIDIGDGADFESISRHTEPGSLAKEGKRLKADIDAYNEGERLLREGMGGFRPKRKVRFQGNHEGRMTAYLDKHPELEGLIGLHMLDDAGWEVVPYENGAPGIRIIDGVRYAHFFAQPNTGKPVTGTIATRIARIGGSFVQGHQQGLMRGDVQYATGDLAYGVVAGSCYLHDEPYKGAANRHWRGVVVLNEVQDGRFADMPLSIDYLSREFAGTTVARWLQRNRRHAKDRFSLARKAA
jgi:hypothetical protein